jgi:hypothetical protein
MKVTTFERHGIWPFRRWEQTGEFDNSSALIKSLESNNPELALQLRLNSQRTFMQDWMIWGTARRGRTVRFTFDDGRTIP